MVLGRLQNFIVGKRLNKDSPPPHFLRFRSSKIFIIATICIAIFSDVFLYGVIVPVVPFSISERAGVLESDVQHWTSILLAVYGAALLVSAPVAGFLADHSPNRRLPLMGGLVVLTAATILLCLAQSVGVLVVGRLFQGLAAGIVWTVGQALLVDTVGQAEIGQVMGYVSISMSVGIMMSPLLGGVVYDAAGYYAVYYMCFGILGLDILLRLVMIEKKVAAQWDDVMHQTDVEHGEKTPAATAAGPICTDEGTSVTNMGDKINRSDSPEVNSTDGNAAELTGLARIASAARTLPKHPKLPPVLTLFASRRFVAALWGAFIQASLVTSFDAVLPLFVQDVFGWTSTGAGLIFLPIVIPGFLAPLSGWASDKYGPRWLTSGGFLACIPLFVCLRFVDHNTLNQKVLLCAILTLIGVMLAILMPPLMAEITYIIEAKERRNPGCYGPSGAYAQAYGLFVFAFAAGGVVGPIWSGLIRDKSGWDTMVWTLGVLSLVGAVPTAIFTGGFIMHNNAKSAEERAMGIKNKKRESGQSEVAVARPAETTVGK